MIDAHRILVEAFRDGKPPRSTRMAIPGEAEFSTCTPLLPLTTPEQLVTVQSLTRQQVRVFVLLSEGLSNKEIALRLDVHETTVKAHVSAVFAKLRCRNRIMVALLALRCRLQAEGVAP